MSAKKATKTANVCATMYEGQFDIEFSCVGATVCKFALCSVMPAAGSEECTYSEHSSCLCLSAKYAALESLKNKLSKEMKQIDSGEVAP